MPDVGTAAAETADKAGSFFGKIVEIIDSTNLPQQINDVDLALFSNPWFIVPFLAMISWWVYKQNFKEIIIALIFIGIWYVSGTQYMATLIVGGELQIGKILPVMFGGAAVLGVIVYMYFGRS